MKTHTRTGRARTVLVDYVYTAKQVHLSVFLCICYRALCHREHSQPCGDNWVVQSIIAACRTLYTLFSSEENLRTVDCSWRPRLNPHKIPSWFQRFFRCKWNQGSAALPWSSQRGRACWLSLLSFLCRPISSWLMKSRFGRNYPICYPRPKVRLRLGLTEQCGSQKVGKLAALWRARKGY